jgi:hypothetical protein
LLLLAVKVQTVLISNFFYYQRVVCSASEQFFCLVLIITIKLF